MNVPIRPFCVQFSQYLFFRALQQKSSTPIYSFLGAVSDTMYLQSLKDHNFDVSAANMATAAHTFTIKKQMRLLYSKWKGSV